MKLLKFFGRLKKRSPFIIRQVSGESMLPTLQPGTLVLVLCWFGTLRKDNVVVVRHRGIEKVKRVHQIQERRLYVLGDNHARSTDSHTFGWLDISDVVGRVVWPRV